MLAQNLFGHFNDDVVGLQQAVLQVVLVAFKALQAAWATGENLHIGLRRHAAVGAQQCLALLDFFFLAKAHLGRDVGAGDAQRARFAAAAIAFDDVVAYQRLDGLHRVAQLHGVVAGLVVQVAALPGRQGNALFQQVFVDVDDAAAREDFVEFVAL